MRGPDLLLRSLQALGGLWVPRDVPDLTTLTLSDWRKMISTDPERVLARIRERMGMVVMK